MSPPQLRSALAGLLGLGIVLTGCTTMTDLPSLPRQISLESDCNGCRVATVIVLRADGQVLWRQVGKARLGTADRTLEGRVGAAEFAAIAGLWRAGRLGDLGETVADPQTADGPWQLLRLEGADGTVQQIFRRGDAGPEALAEVIEAIQQLARKLGLSPPQGVGGR
ncbi:MAG: hypothetical protein EKK53_14135 [Burkholderiales bacterium]|nr:MAG: hypothetical protein EKK53_14135 [Burkholderiales bacterium]